MRRAFIVSFAGLWMTAAVTASEVPGYFDVDLKLTNAVFSGDDRTKGKDLYLYLGCRDGLWKKRFCAWAGGSFKHGIWDRSRAFNAMEHEGVLTRFEDKGKKVRLEVEVVLHPDPWVPGGKATYVIELTRDGRAYSGTFSGSCKGKPVKGGCSGTQRALLWPSPMRDVQRIKPGEHPRLIFRKRDLPALRKRAETPEGKAMIARLKKLLGGEDMPTVFSPAKSATDKNRGRMPVGEGYTLWHGMGFGFLYQLTGDTKYADLARKCVDKAREGVRDRDPRYSWQKPGGKLRAGSSYAAIAHAYDFCYDAWDKTYRETIAREIQDKVFAPTRNTSGEKAKKEPVNTGLVFRTGGGQHSPLSNHYMAWNGGGGTAMLGVLGDPGVDNEVCQRALRVFLSRAKRALTVSYGSRGYFYEGHHCGRLSTNTGFSSFIQALRVALGQDLVANYDSGRWLLTKWIYEIVRTDGKLCNPQRGMYASPHFGRTGHSSGGDFSQSFGICPKEHTPALLWFYNNVICPGKEKDYDALVWPHRAVYAFVNWPLDVKPKRPADVLPHAIYDLEARYWVFRSGWEGENDIVVTSARGDCKVLGIGLPGKAEFRIPSGDAMPSKEKDGVIAFNTKHATMLFDRSGKSGAEMLFVVARRDPPAARVPKAATPKAEEEKRTTTFVDQIKKKRADARSSRPGGIARTGTKGAEVATMLIQGWKVSILTLHRGDAAPEVKIVGEGAKQNVEIGGRIVSFKGTRPVFGK